MLSPGELIHTMDVGVSAPLSAPSSESSALALQPIISPAKAPTGIDDRCFLLSLPDEILEIILIFAHRMEESRFKTHEPYFGHFVTLKPLEIRLLTVCKDMYSIVIGCSALWTRIFPEALVYYDILDAYLFRSCERKLDVSLSLSWTDLSRYSAVIDDESDYPHSVYEGMEQLTGAVDRIETLRIRTDDHRFLHFCTAPFHDRNASSLVHLEVVCTVPDNEEYINSRLMGDDDERDYDYELDYPHLPMSQRHQHWQDEAFGLLLFAEAPVLSFARLENINFSSNTNCLAKSLEMSRTHEYPDELTGNELISGLRETLQTLTISQDCFQWPDNVVLPHLATLTIESCAVQLYDEEREYNRELDMLAYGGDPFRPHVLKSISASSLQNLYLTIDGQAEGLPGNRLSILEQLEIMSRKKSFPNLRRFELDWTDHPSSHLEDSNGTTRPDAVARIGRAASKLFPDLTDLVIHSSYSVDILRGMLGVHQRNTSGTPVIAWPVLRRLAFPSTQPNSALCDILRQRKDAGTQLHVLEFGEGVSHSTLSREGGNRLSSVSDEAMEELRGLVDQVVVN